MINELAILNDDYAMEFIAALIHNGYKFIIEPFEVDGRSYIKISFKFE